MSGKLKNKREGMSLLLRLEWSKKRSNKETESVQLKAAHLAEEMPASETDKNGCVGKYRSQEGKQKKNEQEEEEEEEKEKDGYTRSKSSCNSQTYSRQLADEAKPQSTRPPSLQRNIAPFEQETSEYDFIMSRLYDPAFLTDPDFELLRLDVFEPIRVSQILPQIEAEEKHCYLTKV